MQAPPPDRPTLLQRYLAHRRPLEVVFWCLFIALQVVANTLVAVIDNRRGGRPFPAWEAWVWEASSNLMWLALLPVIALLLRRWPLHLGVLRAHLPLHLLASLGISLVHVAGMVGLRQLAYAAQGRHYRFGHWPSEWAYEAIKDVRSYAMIVAIMLGYRLLLWRWQGEATELQAPDEPDPPAAAAHPDHPANDTATAAPPPPPERFLIKKLGKEFLLPTSEIEWVQACGNYVNLHRRQHDYPLRSTLAAIEKQLLDHGFVRVHRSYLANLALVAVIEPTESGDARLRMADGSTLPCSRTHLDALRARLAGGAAPRPAPP